MSRHRARRGHPRTRWLIAPLAACLLVLVALAHGVTGSYALFHDTATVSAGTATSAGSAFTAGSIATPTVSTPAQISTGTTVSWPATAVGTLGATASAYDVYRYAAASGGTGTLACSTTGALSCVDTSKAAGTVYYELRAHFATNWIKTSSRVAFTPDRTAPTVTISTPVYNCAGDIVSCGTASDGGGGKVSTVEYTLLRTYVPSRGATTYACWNGSAWVSNSTSTCDYRTASGTTSWTVPGSRTTASANSANYDSYTLSVRATDSFGNVSSPTTATVNP